MVAVFCVLHRASPGFFWSDVYFRVCNGWKSCPVFTTRIPLPLSFFRSILVLAFCASAYAEESYKTDIEPLLINYCFDCHGDGSKEGEFEMDGFKDLSSHTSDTKHWIPVWKNLRSQIMPPSEEAQPSPADKRKMLSWIESTVFKLDPENPDPGRVTIRRLNRNEYQNTVFDLLGVEYNHKFPDK